MVVIKTIDIVHGHIFESPKEILFEEALSLIKKRKECGDTGQIEFDYIGEKGIVDINPKKLKCKICRSLEREELKRERER